MSKALLIIGMFMPKFGLAPFFGGALGAGLAGSCAASFTRSQALASLARDPLRGLMGQLGEAVGQGRRTPDEAAAELLALLGR